MEGIVLISSASVQGYEFLLTLEHLGRLQDFAPAGRFSLQDTALASLSDARQQAREVQEQLRGRLSSVYLEQCRTVAPDFRARGRRCDCVLI